MSSYFVSSAGSDSNAGTIGSPFLTIGHAMGVIATSGDTVNLNGGNTFSEHVVVPSGTSLTLQSYGTGQATINGSNTGIVLSITDANGPVLISNIELISTDTSNTYFNTNITYSDGQEHLAGTTISGCTITGGFVTIRIAVGGSEFVSNILIENNTISGSTNSGITIGSGLTTRTSYANVNITNNTVSGVTGYSSSGSSGVGIVIEGSNGSLGPNYIQFNHIFNCGSNAFDTTGAGGPAGLFPFNADSVIAQYNVVHDIFCNSGGGGSADGIGIDIDLGNTNCQLLYNYCYNNQGPGITHLSAFVEGTKNVIAFNICINNCLAGGDLAQVLFFDSGGAVDFYNNTVVSSAPYPTVFFSDTNAPSNKRILNNVFVAPAGTATVLVEGGVTLGNLVMNGNYQQSGIGGFSATYNGTNHTSLASWQSATGLEANGLAADTLHMVQPQPPPALVPATLAGASVFAPVSGSPVFNAGVSLSSFGILELPDFLGNPWTQNTIGAIYKSGTPNNYISAVYADSPMAFWKFAEPGSVFSVSGFVDSLNSFLTGVWTSPTQGSSAIVAGDGADSTLLNGSTTIGEIASIPNAPVFTSLTVEVWLKTGNVSASQQYIISSVNNSISGQDLIFEIVNGNQVNFAVSAPSSPGSGSANTVLGQCSFTFVINTTYHIVGTWTGTTMAFYINGTQHTTTYDSQQTVTNPTLTQIYVGNVAPNIGNVPLSGNLSNIALYPSVLSQSRVTAHFNAGNSVSYSVVGPTSAAPGVTSSNFTITPTFTGTDTLTLTSAHGSTITPSSISISSAATHTFTIEGSSVVADTITITSTNGLTVFGSPISFGIAQPFTVSVTENVLQGNAVTVTYSPAGSTSDVVTPSDGQGGTFSPSTLTFASSSTPQTTQYTPAVSGLVSVSGSSSLGAAFTPLSTFSYGVTLDVYLDESGTGFVLICHTQTIQGNSNYASSPIISINADPEFFVNNNSVAIGPPTWASGITPFAIYPALCGGVRSLAMVNAGTSNYVTPTFTQTVANGGTGTVLANSGVGTTETGILSYTITNFGSGYTESFMVPIPGQSPTQQAFAYVTVVSNVVTSVLPTAGSTLAYGVGYTGSSMTGVVLNGSAAFNGSTGTFGPGTSGDPSAVPGTNLTVTCNIGQYVVPPEVTTPGTGYKSPPEYAVTDTGGSGSGATCVPVMSGPLASDSLTFTAPANLFATAVPAAGWPVNQSGGVFTAGGPTPPMPATGSTPVSIVNSAGQLEGPVGHAPGFLIVPTMLAGTNEQLFPTALPDAVYFTGKNKLWASNAWQLGSLCTGIAQDSTFYPQYWTPNSLVTSQFYGFGFPEAQYMGIWSLPYDDDFYGGIGSQSHPAYVAIQNNGFGTTWTPVNGPFSVMPTLGTVTVGGGQVTAIAVATGGSGLEGVLITLSGGGGNGAAFVGVVSAGALQSCVQICGGSNYFAGTPTAIVTPVSVSGGVVTIKYESAYVSANAGNYIELTMVIGTGSDGIQHCHNPWVVGPGNTADRSVPYATDDNVVAARTKNGNGVGVQRFMTVLGAAAGPNCIDSSDILPGTAFSWNYYPEFNGITPPGPPNQPTFTGVTTLGSPTVTGIADTSTLSVGQSLMGGGIANFNGGAQTNILSIDSSSQITLNINALGTGTQTLSPNNTPSGTPVFNFVRQYYTNPSQSGLTYTPSGLIYSSGSWANSGSDGFGTYFNIGTLGSADGGNYLTGGFPNQNIGIAELRSTVPHGLKTGMNASALAWQNSQGFTATTTLNSTNLTGAGVAGGELRFVNQIIEGPGIQAGTTITAVNSTTSVTLSLEATASATVSLMAKQTINWSLSGLVLAQSSEGDFWVTGPDTVACIFVTGASSGGTTQVPSPATAGTETPIYLPFSLAAPTQNEPYEYVFSDCAQYPACTCHLNLLVPGSDNAIQKIAQLAFQYAPNIDYVLERGNEPWNSIGGTNEIQWEQSLAFLCQYYPTGTSLFPHFTSTGGTASFVTNGSAMPAGGFGYAIFAANNDYVFKNAFVAAGGNASQVKLTYGAQYGATEYVSEILSAVSAENLPQDFVAVAPYQNLGQFGTYQQAAFPAGFPGSVGTPGNMPVDYLNDFNRHYLMYGADLQATWKILTEQLAGTTIKTMAYEGATTALLRTGPFTNQIAEDAFSHESYRYLIRGYFLGMQRGHPNVAESGVNIFPYFCNYLNAVAGPMWKMGYGVPQPIGSSLANQFVTPQGGYPGNGNPNSFYQTNATPGLTGLQDWIGAMGAATPTVESTPSSLSLGSTQTGTAGTPSTYSVSGSDLTADILISAPTGVELSTDGVSYSGSLDIHESGGTVSSTTIDVRISASASVGPISGTVQNTSTGAATSGVTVNGTVTPTPTPTPTPTISVTPTSLSLGTTPSGTPSSPQTYSLSGSGLTASIGVTAPTGVELSTNGSSYTSTLTVTESGGSVPSTTIDVRISSSASVGSISGNVSNASTGATTENVAVSGTVTPTPTPTPTPTISVTPTSLSLTTTPSGTPGSPSTYSLSGSGLTASIIASAPTGVELSTDAVNYSSTLTIAESGGSVPSTTIDVRISASASVGSISGNVTNTSTGATNQNVAVSGTVTPTPTPTGTASISGPSTGLVGFPVQYVVSVSTDPPYHGTIVFTDSSNSGQFFPSEIFANKSSSSYSFTYISTIQGSRNISLIANPVLSSNTISLSLNVAPAQSMLLSGPPLTEFLGVIRLSVGVASQNFTVTPNGLYTGTVILKDSSLQEFLFNNGTFTPPFLTFNNSNNLQTFTYTPRSSGDILISMVTNPNITVNQPLYARAF